MLQQAFFLFFLNTTVLYGRVDLIIKRNHRYFLLKGLKNKNKNAHVPLWGKTPVKTLQKNKYLRGSKAGLITRNQLTRFLSLSFPLRKPPPGLARRCRRAAPSCVCFSSLRIGTVTSTWHFNSWLISNTQTMFSRANLGQSARYHLH